MHSDTEIDKELFITTVYSSYFVRFVIWHRADLSSKNSYKSMMLSDIPNLINCIGYTNNSWTLKSDLTGEYLCRLIKHMEKNKYDIAVPRQREKNVETKPLLDFQAGYVLRALDALPKQGTKEPWITVQDYMYDRKIIQKSPIEDGVIEFSRREIKNSTSVPATETQWTSRTSAEVF